MADSSFKKQCEKFLRNQRANKRWKRIVMLFAAAVVFITTYSLILPAITMEGSTQCGIEEHQHGLQCYMRQLVCTMQEDETHVHDDNCYEDRLICQKVEHVHGQSCYCDQDAGFTDEYSMEPSEEDEDAIVQYTGDTESMVQTEYLDIDNADSAIENIDTPELEQEDAGFSDGLMQTEDFSTGAAELFTDGNIDIEEAENSTEDRNTTDVECAEIWEASLPQLTGEIEQDIVLVAESQVGYQESSENYIVAEDGRHMGYTRYGEWYGEPYGDWDAMFAAFCLYYGGVPDSIVPYEADSTQWIALLEKAGLYRVAEAHEPQCGELIFLKQEDGGTAQLRVGVIAEVSGDRLWTVEGNSEDKVERLSYERTSAQIQGYGLLSPDTDNNVSEIQETEIVTSGLTDQTEETEIVIPELTNQDKEIETETIDSNLQIGNTEIEAHQTAGTESLEQETWELTLPELTGNLAQDIVTVAQSQVGYHESVDDCIITEDGQTRGYTYYGDWFEEPYGEWNTMFAGFCLYYSGASGIAVPFEFDCSKWMEGLSEAGLYEEAGIHEPQPGELIFFCDGESNVPSRVGVLANISDGILLVIEGDYEDEVRANTYDENSGEIVGYGIPVYGNDAALMSVLPETVLATGSLTDTLTWTVTENDVGELTLTISGTGDMPDFAKAEDQPWRDYYTRTTMNKIVVEDGVTRIGNNAFKNFCAREISIGSDVASIGSLAFGYMRFLEEVTIPGNVKKIDDVFSYSSTLKRVTLEEGIESINLRAFGGTVIGKIGNNTIGIPASVTEIIAKDVNADTVGYVVADGNVRYYSSEDGVLFERLENGTASILAYPTYGKLTEYRIPDNVTKIGGRAFQGISILQKLTVPASVKNIPQQCMRDSSLETVVFEEGSTALGSDRTNLLLSGCKNLRSVVMPQGFTTSLQATLKNCTALESFTIQPDVKLIWQDPFLGCTALTELVYNAKDCSNAIDCDFNANETNILPLYHLTIGAEVDVLHGPGRYSNTDYDGFTDIAKHAEVVSFSGPNQITIEDGAMDGAPGPLDGLSGTVYVDAQGVVYKYDVETGNASVVYCPNGVAAVTIPKAFSPEEGVTCTVTAVEPSAFTLAQSLEQITFASPEVITSIGAKAFYDCQRLASVNGKTTMEEAKTLFGNASIGNRAFDGTALTGASGSGTIDGGEGKKALEVERENVSSLNISVEAEKTGTWVKAGETEEPGYYQLLTGDTLHVNLSVGNTQADEYSYRVYFETTEEDASLSIVPGTTYNFQGVSAYCGQTEKENVVYLEFGADVSGTISVMVTANYPTAGENGEGSEGGELRIWGVIQSKEESAQNANKFIEKQGNDYIQANWITDPDEFTLTKTAGKASLNLVGDGAGGAEPSENLNWTIQLDKEETEILHYGSDYVRSVDYTDTMTFPMGVSWNEEVISAIKSKGIVRKGNDLYAGEVRIATLTLSGGATMTRLRASIDGESDQITFYWTAANPSARAEMPTNTAQLTIYKDALDVDMEQFNTENNRISNRADATLHYTYAEDAKKDAEAEISLMPKNGNIAFNKTATSLRYFGEDITYTLRLYNDGANPYVFDGSDIRVVDTMSPYTYISSDNMERMFKEEYGQNLTIQIQNAQLAGWQEVTGIDGATAAYQNSANSNLETKTANLTIRRNESNGFTVTAVMEETETTYSGATVGQALQAAGYAVTQGDSYILTWSVENAAGTSDGTASSTFLQGGENRYYYVYATAKDTFQMLTADWPNEYPSSGSTNLDNNAKVVLQNSTGKEQSVKTARTISQAVREAYLRKAVSRNGQLLTDSSDAKDGDILDYELDFLHHGSGVYSNLPMVDDMYGVQYLLVPTEKNQALADKGLETTDREGTYYYILKEGTYNDVVVGLDDAGQWYTAEQIIVTRADTETEVEAGAQKYAYTGLHTQIKWYFPTLTEKRGSYELSVKYSALVDMELLNGASYSIGNMVWMNDKKGSRIYDGLWGGGTIIQFDKSIVTEKGEIPQKDVLAENDYSLIAPGEKITYRLDLTNTGNAAFTLKGRDLADALPYTAGQFQWAKGQNVEITVNTDSSQGAVCTKLDAWTVEDEWNAAAPSAGQQYILWPEDASIEFSKAGTVYLYVTLTFPTDTDSNPVWSRYTADINGSTISNTLYVYRFPSNVTHHLKENGQVLLQKGVYGTYICNNYSSKYTVTDSRIYYNNRDNTDRCIAYYVVLYNGGNKRLYLEDLYDQLPKGFTYKSLISNSGFENSGAYNSLNTIIINGAEKNRLASVTENNELIGEVSYRSATVTQIKRENGLQQFHISGDSSAASVRYDEEEKRYYLMRGEAIVFGYICEIGETAETEDAAENIIGMPYYDYLGTGAQTVPENEVTVTGTANNLHTDQNDGTFAVESSSQAVGSGFPQTAEKQWLISDVSVSRGGIIPGVTKYTVSYTDTNGTTTNYTNNASPYATVNWRIRLHNSGTLSMTDYTLTDIMPNPYRFVGNVGYTIYYANGIELYHSDSVFAISERQNEDDKTIEITAGGSKYSLTIGGEEITIPLTLKINSVTTTANLKLAISRDDDNNEVMKLRLDNRYLSIPEGGHADITLSSKNLTTHYQNTAYTNQAILTPNVQHYTQTSHGALVRDENGNLIGARNTSPVVTSFSYSTSSVKMIEEVKNDPNASNNSASSDAVDPDKNYILLTGTDSSIRYTMKVSNDTSKAMKHLVFIDSLPEPGDHSPFNVNVPRDSQFKINLLSDPKVTVKVITEDKDTKEKKEITLAPGQYKITYNTRTQLSSGDWGHPEQDQAWNDDWDDTASNETRTIRVEITDKAEDSDLIPAKAQVEVSFLAKIDSEWAQQNGIEPGEVAWNNFGYHYGLKTDNSVDLEAMPLVVGVKIPEVPILQKELVDSSGQPVNAPKDTRFSFIVYEGEKLSETYDTEEELISALKTLENRKYCKFTVTVPEGKSVSEPKKLYAIESDEGSSVSWSFEEGRDYTIVELPCPENYELYSWNKDRKADHYTFTYELDVAVRLICANEYQEWAIDLEKVDSADQTKQLSGAVFALYSPNEKEKLSDNDYETLCNTFSVQPDKQKQVDSMAWYLKDIKATADISEGLQQGSDDAMPGESSEGMTGAASEGRGRILWEGLTEDAYYLEELKAPEGYTSSWPAQIIRRTESKVSIQAENEAIYELPQTGGAGTLPYTLGGALLMGVCLLYGYRTKCKRKEEGRLNSV